MPNSSSIKKVQRLIGQIVALSRFIFHLINNCEKVFKVLTNQKSFEWMTQCIKGFKDLKSYLTSPPILSKPIDGEELYINLVVSGHIVSSILIYLEDKIQKLIYYVNKALDGAKARYSNIEKLAIAQFISAKKLQPYC